MFWDCDTVSHQAGERIQTDPDLHVRNDKMKCISVCYICVIQDLLTPFVVAEGPSDGPAHSHLSIC